MTRGFTLNNWVDWWLNLLAPQVVNPQGEIESVITRYDVLQKLYEASPETRRAALGETTMHAAPLVYWQMTVILKIGINAWETLSIKERAKWIAHAKLEQMCEVVDAHARWRKEALKKEHDKLNGKV